MKWWDWMPWSLFFERRKFKPASSLYSFTFIKRLFSSSLLSAIRVVSSAYLRLLIFLPAILIPACASSSLVICIMYTAYREKEMATHSSILAWRIPGTEEPGGLLSMGWHRVGHDWSDLAAAAAVWCMQEPDYAEVLQQRAGSLNGKRLLLIKGKPDISSLGI